MKIIFKNLVLMIGIAISLFSIARIEPIVVSGEMWFIKSVLAIAIAFGSFIGSVSIAESIGNKTEKQ